ncbi:hypothetical protein D3C72_2540570 [compost metagenome]
MGVRKPAPVKVAEKPRPQAPKIVKVIVPAKAPAEKPTIMIIRGTSTEFVNR